MMKSDHFTSLTGAILAGGKGSRMANQDKGLLVFDGQPMALKIALPLNDIADSVFINANRNIKQYRELGFAVISDLETHYDKGPLSGLFTCLQATEASHLLISPCDTPLISRDAFLVLKEACIEAPNQIHYLLSGEDKHPLHAIIPVKAALLALDTFMAQTKRYSVMMFYEFFGCKGVLWHKTEELLNVNTPDSLERNISC